MGEYWAKGHLAILSTVVGMLGFFLWNIIYIYLDVDWSVAEWCLDGVSLWSFLESGVVLG